MYVMLYKEMCEYDLAKMWRKKHKVSVRTKEKPTKEDEKRVKAKLS